jgi:hypothetical protein
MLCAAPVALPAAVKAAAAPRPFVGRAIPIDYFEIGELKPLDFSDVARPLVDAIPEHYATEVTPMSDFADDLIRMNVINSDEPIVMRGAPIDLTRHRLVYLGSPYTKYASGLDAAFQDVCAIAADLIKEGVKVYSPIAHTHPIAIHGNLDPRNHDIWLPFDQAMMNAADAMVIADMDGWRESYGVRFEIETFQRAGKPVYFRDRMGFVSDYLG